MQKKEYCISQSYKKMNKITGLSGQMNASLFVANRNSVDCYTNYRPSNIK